MAADEDAVGLSRVHMYEVYSALTKQLPFLFLNILILLECTQSADNLFHSFTVLWEKEYFLTSNLLCPFAKAKSCPLVLLPVLILTNILGSTFS